MWSYDKRLLYGIKYGSHTFVYIWLIPLVTTASVLGLSSFQQIVADGQELDNCLHQSGDKELKQSAHLLRTLMLIQEGILISVFFSALLSLVVADRIYKSQAEMTSLKVKIHVSKKYNEDKEAISFGKDKQLANLQQSSTSLLIDMKVKTTEYDF